MRYDKNIHIIFSILIILGLTLSLKPVTMANAQEPSTYYVTQSSSSDNDCNGKSSTWVSAPACPFSTIQKAIASAADGDTIHVAAGSYNNADNHPWSWTGKSLNFIFEDQVSLANLGNGCFLIQTNYNRFKSVIPGGAACYVIYDTDSASGFEVADGVHDLVIDGLFIRGGGNGGSGFNQDGIRFQGNNSNIQVVNSMFKLWQNGIHFVSTPTGVIDIQGNLFVNNVLGILAPDGSTFSVKYNSWGHPSGPLAIDGGDGISGFASTYYTPWTYADLSITAPENSVVKDSQVTYHFVTTARQVMGLDFTIAFSYDKLEYISSDTDSSAFSAETIVDTSTANTDGMIKFHGVGTNYEPVSGNSQEILAVTFKGKATGNYSIVVENPTNLRIAMDQDNGPSNWIYPAFVSNDGYGEVLKNYTNVTGTVSMQGRVNRDGAVVTLWQDTTSKYTNTSINKMTDNVSMTDVNFGSYVVSIIKDGYLDINKTLAKSLSISTTDYTITTVELKGGDANDDDAITIADAALIGNDYGKTTELSDFTDINSSGKVDIFDLALMGGNYDATSSSAYTSWTAQ